MSIVAFLLALAATIVFTISALIRPQVRVNLLAAGLALLSAAWVIQSVWGGNTVHG